MNQHYEIRTKGDGEYDYFIENSECDDCGWDPEADSRNLARCRKHAKCCKGRVVRVTAEPTEPKHRAPNGYDRGQHQLICQALKVSDDANAPGDTAYEAVCVLLSKIDLALGAKTLKEAKKALRRKSESFQPLRCYGT